MILLNELLFFAIFTIIFSYFCIFYFKKKKILLDKVNFSEHKKLLISNLNSPPLCGGVIIFVCSLIFFNELSLLKIFSFAILVVGILSDANKINSPKTRILLQFLIISFYIFLIDLNIKDLRVEYLNNLLSIKYISIIFTAFCFLILINGTNFLDGLNTLVVGYYILVLSILILVSSKFDLILNQNIFFLLIILIVIYFLNFFEKIYLGDSGSYLLSFFVAFFVLDFSYNNSLVSPYFIGLLLWYPAFENLFSILRRSSFKERVYMADQLHLHQLIYKYFVKKNFFNKKFVNSLSANIINIFSFCVFILFYNNLLKTKILVLIVIFNLIVYLTTYFLIKKKLNHLK